MGLLLGTILLTVLPEFAAPLVAWSTFLVMGPLLGTILPAVLPEFAPLVAWSTFLYAALLLVHRVGNVPGRHTLTCWVSGAIASRCEGRPGDRAAPCVAAKDAGPRRGARAHRAARRRAELWRRARDRRSRSGDPPRPGAWPDRSERLGQDHHAQRHLRLQRAGGTRGHQDVGDIAAAQRCAANLRTLRGIARTFQTPRSIGEASVLQNMMIGGTITGRGTLLESLFGLPRHRADERRLTARAMQALRIVGLEALVACAQAAAAQRAKTTPGILHALMPPCLPSAGRSTASIMLQEIRLLGALIGRIWSLRHRRVRNGRTPLQT